MTLSKEEFEAPTSEQHEPLGVSQEGVLSWRMLLGQRELLGETRALGSTEGPRLARKRFPRAGVRIALGRGSR